MAISEAALNAINEGRPYRRRIAGSNGVMTMAPAGEAIVDIPIRTPDSPCASRRTVRSGYIIP